jgi:hypothetical protein
MMVTGETAWYVGGDGHSIGIAQWYSMGLGSIYAFRHPFLTQGRVGCARVSRLVDPLAVICRRVYAIASVSNVPSIDRPDT